MTSQRAGIAADHSDSGARAAAPGETSGDEALALTELLFFAYRDFVAEPDRILTRYGFGRAHHRVLHFVSRYPGQTVAGLLTILAITKQSLARVLRDLVTEGFIEQRAGDIDRRQRLLFPTAKGEALAGELMALQRRRISQSLARVAPAGRPAVEAFLLGLVEAEAREGIARMVLGRSVGGA